MKTRQAGGDVVISVHTQSNRSTGVFLMFCGLVATWPVLYILRMWFSRSPQTWADWAPAAAAAVLLTGVGFLLTVASYKRIVVRPDAIIVTDGPLHKPMTFHWTAAPVVRLQSIISERNDRPKTTWIVKLVSERYEYTLDERLGQQLESRGVAEAVAKALGCPLLEKDENHKDITIDARDLDMPFAERVKKYPALLGHPTPQPVNAGVQRVERDGRLDFTWGIVTGGLLMSLVVMGIVFFAVSAIPPRPDAPSYFERARRDGDYHLYVYSTAIILGALLVSAGFRVRISLTSKAVHLYETLWGVPVMAKSVANCDVEEVQVVHTVRGPLVQIVSDKTLLQFRTGDSEVAGWLAHEIRLNLAGDGIVAPTRC